MKGYMVQLSEGTIINLDVANHDSPYKYDRHVPLIFLGYSIPLKVHSKEFTRTIDIAPSIAKLIGIQLFGKVNGKPLSIIN